MKTNRSHNPGRTTCRILLFLIAFCLISQPVVALDLGNISVPNPETGKYTQYWFKNQSDFDGFGFAYSLTAPFTAILGPWFFAIIWSAIIYRSYEKTGTITMPLVLGILTGTVWGAVFPGEATMVWTILFGIGLAAITIKYLVERD